MFINKSIIKFLFQYQVVFYVTLIFILAGCNSQKTYLIKHSMPSEKYIDIYGQISNNLKYYKQSWRS